MEEIIIFSAKYLIVGVIIGVIATLLKINRSAKLQFIGTVIIAGGIAFLIARTLSHIFYDPRPFVDLGVKPLIDHTADNGFPSDHALFSMTLTAATYFFSRKIAYGMFVVTLIIGAARVAALVHSPIDILGAWAIAISGAILSYFIVRRIFSRWGHPSQQHGRR